MSNTISAVILAGGRSRRMNGQDKGLQCLHNKPLFLHCYQRLQPQISDISINANRNLCEYKKSHLDVFQDTLENFQGPLSGILTSLQQAKTNFVLFVPCDCPNLPLNLCQKLEQAIQMHPTSLIAYAHDGEREHPTFCLISKKIAPALEQYLQSGQRKMLDFIHTQPSIAVDFSENKQAFKNINYLKDLNDLNAQ